MRIGAESNPCKSTVLLLSYRPLEQASCTMPSNYHGYLDFMLSFSRRVIYAFPVNVASGAPMQRRISNTQTMLCFQLEISRPRSDCLAQNVCMKNEQMILYIHLGLQSGLPNLVPIILIRYWIDHRPGRFTRPWCIRDSYRYNSFLQISSNPPSFCTSQVAFRS